MSSVWRGGVCSLEMYVFFFSFLFLLGCCFSMTDSNRVFSLKLPFHIQWQDLKDLFRMGGGTIIRADVALGADGRSRGFGMVSFASEQDAEKARAMFNGYVPSLLPLNFFNNM